MHLMTTRAREPALWPRKLKKQGAVRQCWHPATDSISLNPNPLNIPNDRVAAEALESTGGHDRDFAVGISENDTDQSGDESESTQESWVSITDSDL